MVFFIFNNFLLDILLANSEEPDQTPCSATSCLVHHCLPMSQKKDARLIWVNKISTMYIIPYTCIPNFVTKFYLYMCLIILPELDRWPTLLC